MARFMDVHDGYIADTRQDLEYAHALDLANQDAEGMVFE